MQEVEGIHGALHYNFYKYAVATWSFAILISREINELVDRDKV